MLSFHRPFSHWVKGDTKWGKRPSGQITRIHNGTTPKAYEQPVEKPRESENPNELAGSRDEPVEQPKTLVEENLPAVPRPSETGSPETQPLEIETPGAGPVSGDETPIWSQSMERFAREKSQLHEVMKAQVGEIQNLEVDSWDTWSNDQPKASDRAWLRRLKAYLPQLKSLKPVALSLSNLDPHKIAPWVTAGIFLAAEFCFESIDPLARDKAMGTILKTNIIVSKWLDSEHALKCMKERSRSSNIDNIERQLKELYFDSLVLISSVYKSGKKRGSRAAATLISEPAEWDRKYQLLSDRSSACSELKSQVELELKKLEANIDILNWIRNGREDPEPGHQTVKERTGVDDPTCRAGEWFLETEEFSSWIGQIHRNEAAKSAFWLNGSMGTGKTTLMCRVISHYEESPISGVRFVRYYCFGSQTATESKVPTYETILRALCYRLAWNSDGSVAEPARRLYDLYKVTPDAEPTTKTTWEPLLRDLISSGAPIVFVIDALDECKSEYDSERLLTFFRGLRQESSGPYFLISSRLHVNVEEHFKDSTEIFNCVQPQAGEDMDRFIKSQIDSKKEDVKWGKSIFFEEDGLRERLKSALSESADGMFRWVEIWVRIFFPKNRKAIRRPEYAEELLNELENLQSLAKLSDGEDDESLKNKKIEEAYLRLWNSAGDQYKKYQIRLFQVVMGAFQKLSPQELLEAVSFDLENPDKYDCFKHDELEGLYCSFLKQDSRGFLDFEHISAKIFVFGMKEEDSNMSIFSEKHNDYILASIALEALKRPSHTIWTAAELCLNHLGKRTKENIELPFIAKVGFHRSKLFERPIYLDHFGGYIIEHWIDHCQMFRRDYRFMQRMCKFVQDAQSSLQAWVSLLNDDDPYFTAMTRSACQDGEIIRTSPFLCMVNLDFSPFVQGDKPGTALLPGFVDITVRNLKQQTPLHIACINKNSTLVKDLLEFERIERGSCLYLLEAEDYRGRIPMREARNEKTVEILLRYERLESLASPADGGFCTSRLLDWEDRWGRTPLFPLIRRSSDAFLEQIFARYRLGPSQSLDDIIWYAVDFGKIKAVELLIKNKPNINAKESSQRTLDEPPLHKAAQGADLEMIDLLLNWGAGIHTVGNKYGSVICAAVASGKQEIIEYILDRGASINDSGGIYGTALGVAAGWGYLNIANFLLEKGADINAIGGKYQTPLGAAANFAKPEMVAFLIEKGADIGLLGERNRATVERLMRHPTECHFGSISFLMPPQQRRYWYRKPRGIQVPS